MNTHPSRKFWLYALFNSLLLVLIAYWLWQQNQAIALPEPALAADAKLSCVSYAPYYQPGVTPLEPTTHISHEQIDSDLALLSKKFACVRIYSVGQGLDYVPEAASKLGLKVLLGVWIGWIPAKNQDEIKLGIKLANEYPETIKGMIVGNEVLLRKEQTEATMQQYISQVKQAVSVPVSYADVWEFWLKHKKLESSVDFVTVHILPYWEDKPQPIDQALPHTEAVMTKLATNFSKPILIGETGWPSVGRQRNGAKPGLINQAWYMRAFLQVAQQKHWNYNLIEAMDQPWKRELEGAVGGYWGIYNSDLQPKFNFTGPLAERQDGWQPVLFAGIGLGVFLILGLALSERRASALISLASLGAILGVALLLGWQYLFTACRNGQEWFALGSIVVITVLHALCLVWVISKNSDTAHNLLRFVMFYSLLASFITSSLILFDGRYRDFPIALYALLALQMAVAHRLLRIPVKPRWKHYVAFNLISIGFAAIIYGIEPHNISALLWLVVTLLIARATWPRKPNQHTFLAQ